MASSHDRCGPERWIHDWNEEGSARFRRPSRRIRVQDETLREGLQSASAGVATDATGTPEDRAFECRSRLIRSMERLRIDSVSLGIPVSSPDARDLAERLLLEIVDRRLSIAPNLGGRTVVDDVRPIVDISQRVGRSVEACLFIGSSPIRQYVEDWDLDLLVRRTREAVRFASGEGLPVTFITEDTTRSTPADLRRLLLAAVEAGARRVCLCDTVGHATPEGARNLVTWARRLLDAEAPDIEIDWHGHQDRGLGLANALAAIEAGAERIHATALGLGERVGNTSMEQLLVNLRLLGLRDDDLTHLAEYVEQAAAFGLPIAPNAPVVGSDAFRTATGVHAAAVTKALRKGDERLADAVYSAVPASWLGRSQEIRVGPVSGAANVRAVLGRTGIEVDDSEVRRILAHARATGRVLTPEETIEFARGAAEPENPTAEAIAFARGATEPEPAAAETGGFIRNATVAKRASEDGEGEPAGPGGESSSDVAKSVPVADENSPDRVDPVRDGEPRRELDDASATGNYFVSNYPPFSCWNLEGAERYREVLAASRPSAESTPLGLYVHVPFCVKRCEYCYYLSHEGRVDEIEPYLDEVAREAELLAEQPTISGRDVAFVYFGGGTPSILTAEAIESWCGRLQASFPWSAAREVTFECAPRSVNERKLEAMRRAGVTRVSLGVQQLDDDVLKTSGRVHEVRDVLRAWEAIRTVGFDVVNLDLIVGLPGESAGSFEHSLERVIDLGPESVTLYQLEVPLNTPLYRAMESGSQAGEPASWVTKRDRLRRGFERLEAAGYAVRSAYSAVRDPGAHRFVYQDEQYSGADLLGLGVSSFSHVAGMNCQNLVSMGRYRRAVESGRLPLMRGYGLNADELSIRELILSLKLGTVDKNAFRRRHGVDVTTHFAKPIAELQAAGFVEDRPESLTVTREGLLRIDRLLRNFYAPEHRNIRYT